MRVWTPGVVLGEGGGEDEGRSKDGSSPGDSTQHLEDSSFRGKAGGTFYLGMVVAVEPGIWLRISEETRPN